MRWTLPVLAAALLASLPAVAVQAGGTGAGAETAVPAKKVFRVTFRTVIPPAAEGSKRVEAWIPTPYQDDVQIVRSLEVTSSVEAQRTFDKDTGNRYLHAAFDARPTETVVAKDPREAAWYFGHAEAANIVLSMGRDLTLAPAQKAGPVNFLTGPYVEVDGKPIEIPAKNRTYGHETLNADGTPTAAEKPAGRPSESKLPAPSAPLAPAAPAGR